MWKLTEGSAYKKGEMEALEELKNDMTKEEYNEEKARINRINMSCCNKPRFMCSTCDGAYCANEDLTGGFVYVWVEERYEEWDD